LDAKISQFRQDLISDNFRSYSVGQQDSQKFSFESSPIPFLQMGTQAKAEISASSFCVVMVGAGIQATIDVEGQVMLIIDAGTQLRVNVHVKNNIAPVVIFDNVGIQSTLEYYNDGNNEESILTAGYLYYVPTSQTIFKANDMEMVLTAYSTPSKFCGYDAEVPNFAFIASDLTEKIKASYYTMKFPSSSKSKVILIVGIVVGVVAVGVIIGITVCCCKKKKAAQVASSPVIINNNNNNVVTRS